MTTTDRIAGAPALDERVTVFGGGYLDGAELVTVFGGGSLDDDDNADFYSEDQPRDEAGRWTSEGGGEVFKDASGKPVSGIVRSKGAAAAARELRKRATDLEPTVSKVLQDVAARSGAHLDRFEFRLKEPDSIARKVENYAKELKISEKEVLEQGKIQDYLRYTVVEPSTDDYISTVQSVSDDLKDRGISLAIDNFWVKGDAYNGINAQGTDRQGRTFEVQFHTTDSLRIAEENHPDYEYVRVKTNPEPERRIRFDRMQAKTDAQPFPKEPLAIGKPRVKEFK